MIVSPALLRAIPLFSTLSDPELQAVLRSARQLHFPKDNVVFHEGDRGDSLLVMLSGRVKVLLSGDRGQELILSIMEPPSFLGEIALVDESPRSATAVTLTRTDVLAVTQEQFHELIGKHQPIALKIVRQLAGSLRDATEHVRTLSMFDIHGRILRALLKLAKQRGTKQQTRIVIQPRPSHLVLSQMVGCSRETVSRAMKLLQETGHVRVTRTAFALEERTLRQYGPRV